MDEKASYLVFFETWYHLAEGRDTDEKRLAFYDTIMRYAFEGIEPERPVKGVSPGEVWAAWDAFVLAKEKIDFHQAKVRAGQAGKGVSRKHIESKAEAELKQSESKSEAKGDINKNKNKTKNIDIAGSGDPAPSRKADASELFERFWAAYPSTCPRKYDKSMCRRKWLAMFHGRTDPEAFFETILAGLGKWRQSKMWTDGGGQYIMTPHRWLNGECWEDAPPPQDSAPEDEAAAAQRAYKAKEAEILDGLRRKGLVP